VNGALRESVDSVSGNRPRRTIHEYDAKRILAAAGVPVARERLVRDLGAAQSAAAEIGYPVVLKVASDDIAHKTDVGLVAVGIADERTMSARWQEFESKLAKLVPTPQVNGFLVQEMVANGVMIELLDDVALRMLPLRQGDAEAMIAETHAHRVLAGVRGAPPADTAALVKALYAIADYAWRDRARIAELDVNPIKVRAVGLGCVVVDALIAPQYA
jgi:acyl-CoA synthetase (NDP forming)